MAKCGQYELKSIGKLIREDLGIRTNAQALTTRAIEYVDSHKRQFSGLDEESGNFRLYNNPRTLKLLRKSLASPEAPEGARDVTDGDYEPEDYLPLTNLVCERLIGTTIPKVRELIQTGIRKRELDASSFRITGNAARTIVKFRRDYEDRLVEYLTLRGIDVKDVEIAPPETEQEKPARDYVAEAQKEEARSYTSNPTLKTMTLDERRGSLRGLVQILEGTRISLRPVVRIGEECVHVGRTANLYYNFSKLVSELGIDKPTIIREMQEGGLLGPLPIGNHPGWHISKVIELQKKLVEEETAKQIEANKVAAEKKV